MNGFAWFRRQCLKPYWVILVGGGYGAFLFQGTLEQAEEMRAHKASWECAVARLRPASYGDVVAPSSCWNHRGFIGTCTLRRYDIRGRLLKRPYAPGVACNCVDCLGKQS